jgi:molecular chaperone DnaJ
MAAQTEWLEKDYYAVLGVPETASEKEIQRAYRRLARELHPDVNPDRPDAEERFKEVSAAYDVIGDSERRKEYDELRQLQKAGVGAGGFGGSGDGTKGGFRVRFVNVEGLSDLDDLGDLGGLGDLFGLGDVFTGAGRRPSRARRGKDIEAELALDFEDAVRGTTATLTVAAEVPCERCGGEGTTGGQPCTECSGRGTQPELRRTTVRVPAGIEDRQLIRVPGQGGAGRRGGPPGDLYVTVQVRPHPLFRRDGPHLRLRVPITFAEAALGADIRVPTLEGDPVTLRVPSGTPSGRTFRVRGRGVPGRGDLLVTAEVAVPQRLSPAERRAVEALAEASTSSPRAHLGV